MNRKLRNGLLIGGGAALFVTWVTLHNLYPPKPRLPLWFHVPADGRILRLDHQRGSAAAARGSVYARILYAGEPADVVDGIMKDCKANGYSPDWNAEKPARISEAQRKYHTERLGWLGADALDPPAETVTAAAQHAFADQTGVVVFAWPAASSSAPASASGPASRAKPHTIVELLFTGAF